MRVFSCGAGRNHARNIAAGYEIHHPDQPPGLPLDPEYERWERKAPKAAPQTVSIWIRNRTPRKCQNAGRRRPINVGDFRRRERTHRRLLTSDSCRGLRRTESHSLLPVWWTHSGGGNDRNIRNWIYRPTTYTHRASGNTTQIWVLKTNGQHTRILFKYKSWWLLSPLVKAGWRGKYCRS